jgi:hypothetical protein
MTDERIIAYLLQDLPEEELERFEDECFDSENWPTQVSLVEEDLIDNYLRNELDPEQRRSFEQNYLTTTARMERVRVAAALLRHLDACTPAPEPTVPAPPVKLTWVERLSAWWGARPLVPRAAMALAVVALIVVAWWFFRPPTARTFATLTLTVSNSDRAVGVQAGRVKLTRDIDALKLSLTLPDPPATATHYRIQLEDENGAIKHSENVQREAQFVRVTIPASKLAPGQYALKLFAITPNDTEQRVPGGYFFTVE